MVTEMTSLQGLIGREYALRSDEPQGVADAIGEQYQPVPKTNAGLGLALADRLDALVGLFAVGLAPTGTKDPFALRRAAIGVVQPLIEHDLAFDLRAAVAKSAKLQPVKVSAEVQAEVLEFITGRLSVLLKEEFRYDVVDAVLAAQSEDPASAARAVEELQGWVEKVDWDTILAGYSRCVRIVRDQKKIYKFDPDKLIEPAEKQLYETYSLESAKAVSSVNDFFSRIVAMLPAITKFFDEVLVMAEDKSLRENRLGLLQRIVALADGIADLSKLEGF
jgi:glycyl-tRNA synthetase